MGQHGLKQMNGMAKLATVQNISTLLAAGAHLLVGGGKPRGFPATSEFAFHGFHLRKDETLALTVTLTNDAGQNRTCPEEVCVVVRIFSFAEEHGVGPANAPAPAASHPLGRTGIIHGSHTFFLLLFLMQRLRRRLMSHKTHPGLHSCARRRR